tara:strand:+ start:123 stop:2249 length:2127 start_codon:yes stop_codon:yes gene_type:complete
MALGSNPHRAGEISRRFMGSQDNMGLADLIPFLGSALMMQEGDRRYQEGANTGSVGQQALGVGQMALSAIPGAYGVKALMKTAPAQKAAAKVVASLDGSGPPLPVGLSIKDVTPKGGLLAPKTLDAQSADVVKALKGLKRGKDGQYVGAPPGTNTPKKLQKIVRGYQEAMLAGKNQREWYESSGRSIFSHAGDDANLANKLTEAFSTTSANTGVAANTGHAVKAHNQAVLNQPVVAGQFPNTMGPTIDNVYQHGGSTTGLKRTPFGENLSLGGGFRAVPNPRPVHDIWDVRAHGYQGKDGKPWVGTVTPPQHTFLDTVDNAIIAQANKDKLGGMAGWDPLRSQAAAWRGHQNQVDAAAGKPVSDSMYDFAEFLPKHSAQGSREAAPGMSTGHMTGLHTAPRQVQENYAKEVDNIMYDELGRDRIAMGNKALAGGHIQGPGIFSDVATVPGRQTLTPVGSVPSSAINPKTGKPLASRDVDDASRTMMDANEAQYGFHTGQDAFAWSRLYDSPKPGRDSYDLVLPSGTINDADAVYMMKQAGINPKNIAIVPTPSGVRLINLTGPDKTFDDIAKKAAESLGVKRPTGQRNSGGYGENAWDKPGGELGQDYAKLFDPKGTPILGKRFDETAPAIQQKMRTLDAQFSKDHGFKVSDVLQDLRAAVSSEGREGIKKMAKRLGLPAYSVAALAVAADQLGIVQTSPKTQRPGLL